MTMTTPIRAEVSRVSSSTDCNLCLLGLSGTHHFNPDFIDVAKREDLERRVGRAWARCLSQFSIQDTCKESLMIDFGRMSISYKNASDQTVVVSLKGEVGEDLKDVQKEIAEVRACIQGVWKGIKWPSSEGESLQTPKKAYSRFRTLCKMPSSHFLESSHFQALLSVGGSVAAQKMDEIKKQIFNSDLFVQRLEAKYDGWIKRQRQEIKELEKECKGNDPAAWVKLEEAKKELLLLERFFEKVKTIDRYALYWAVGMVTAMGPSSFEDRCKVADLIQQGMADALSEELLTGPKASRPLKDFADRRLGRLPIDTEQIETYAKEASVLVIHNEAEVAARLLRENGQRKEGAKVLHQHNPCMTEFVVDNICRLSDGAFDPRQSLNSQGEQWGENPNLVNALTGMRALLARP